jgi:malate synthase
MTALYPSRTDLELNARAMKVLAEDKKNEAESMMDGAWTGHPDQNEIAISQFPFPNQGGKRIPGSPIHPDLRPSPQGVGRLSLEGTRASVRTVIRYRFGVLNGKGASLLDGYMEDLATDRIYRLMIAQRMLHRDEVAIEDQKGEPVPHTQAFISRLFDEELARLVAEAPVEAREKLELARRQSEEMILAHRF